MTRPDFQAPDLRPLIEALDLAIAEYDKAIAAGRTTTALLTIGRASLLTMRETAQKLVEESVSNRRKMRRPCRARCRKCRSTTLLGKGQSLVCQVCGWSQ